MVNRNSVSGGIKNSENYIVVEHLSKKYGKFFAVKDVSFKVKGGEIVGFLGPNGAGKTTTMNILTGCISYNSGVVKILGKNIFNEPLEVKKNIGYLPENPPLYQNMTVFEYLKFIAILKRTKKIKDEIKRVLMLCNLEEKKDKLISSLSKGYKQRVGIAQALIGSPKVLILDEPTSGLDPAQIVQVRHLIKYLAKSHTVIVSTHILSEIQAMCDRIIIINNGVVVADDSEKNLLRSKGKRSHFLAVCCSSEKRLLTALEGLKMFVNVKNIELIHNFIEFELEIKSGEERDVKLLVSKALMENKIPILEFSTKSLSLEQIFINLIENRNLKDIKNRV